MTVFDPTENNFMKLETAKGPLKKSAETNAEEGVPARFKTRYVNLSP